MGARASGQGGFARPRKACWRIFAARRKQALRGSRVRPPGLCLSVAHPRYRGARVFPRRRGLAGHALMPTSGGRPSGARAISRPFLRKFLNFFQPNNSMRACVGHLFNTVSPLIMSIIEGLHFSTFLKEDSRGIAGCLLQSVDSHALANLLLPFFFSVVFSSQPADLIDQSDL